MQSAQLLGNSRSQSRERWLLHRDRGTNIYLNKLLGVKIRSDPVKYDMKHSSRRDPINLQVLVPLIFARNPSHKETKKRGIGLYGSVFGERECKDTRGNFMLINRQGRC